MKNKKISTINNIDNDITKNTAIDDIALNNTNTTVDNINTVETQPIVALNIENNTNIDNSVDTDNVAMTLDKDKEQIASDNVCISIKDIDLFYGEYQALKKINLDISKNEITAFIGPSGCGKSTLLRCLNRMNDLIEHCTITGSIKVFNEDKGCLDDIYARTIDVNELRKRVGMVFQKPNVFPMSIFDNIAFGPRTHGIKKKHELEQIVQQSLSSAGIWDEVKDNLKKSALSLSGGQQQRICIARALAVQPKILLMDEPTSALDPISTGIIEELCDNLKDKYTIVLVTHNMQQALRISQKTAFFYLGEMLEFGETEAVFSNPKNKRAENYITGRFG